MTTERRSGPVLASFSRNEAALSDVSEISCNLSINLSGEASIFHKDAVYSKSKSEPFGPLILQAQVTVADHKERGIPKV
ncbi:MAG: hypothetical protein RMX57_12930, partial [Planktomarina sp.]|nr:hypothetical protein [Planktomarina sp.]